MTNVLLEVQKKYKKPNVIEVRSGDYVKVTQKITEGSKQRLQVFEGLVIKVSRRHSLTYRIIVRKITSSVGVEKSFLMHSPNVHQVEVLKRSKVRRNYLSYMRNRLGKSARLKTIDFNKQAVNQGIKTDAIVKKIVDIKQSEDTSVKEADKLDKDKSVVKQESDSTKQEQQDLKEAINDSKEDKGSKK